MTHRSVQTFFFLALLTGTVILLFLVVKPFFASLVLAFTFAILFYPLHRRFVTLFRGHRGAAALLTILIIMIVVLVPLTFLSVQVIGEGKNLLAQRESIFESVSKLPLGDSPLLRERLELFSSNLDVYINQGVAWLFQHIGTIFSSITKFLLNVVISLIATYFLLKSGPDLKAKLIQISPLSDRFDRQIIDRLQMAVSSVIRGALVIAVIQGLLSGIGFTVTGIPNPALWGTVAMFASLIPGIGTALVMVPAVLYLFLTGHVGGGIALTIWGGTAVGLIDNFLSPFLVGRSIKIHGFVIMLSVLGGLGVFGPIGFLVGPLVVSFLFALLDIYPTLILHEKK